MAESSIILGKYELLEVIGDGAEGRVYKATCIADSVSGVAKGELVAVKRLKSTGHEKESLQFRRQTEILRKLNHLNIVSYRDSFVWREKELEEDVHCLVMELLDGETLKALMERHRDGIPWAEAGGILSQVLQALQHASKSGVVHRDLKPSNIFITGKGIPKLVDFGIARQDDGEATATSSAAGAKGTFDYMAPDFALQPGGFRGDEQSDIFSFGVLVFHALTGRLPFPALGENADRAYYIRWLGKSPPTPEFRHPVFRVLSHARSCIGKCIEVDRQLRFKTFDEVMDDFAKIGYRKLKHGNEAFEFIDWLGKGGFGEVFHARRISDKRHVAIKRLFSASQSSRFVREAKILREAAHPHLTEYVDFVEVRLRDEEREYYLVLEFLTGMPDAGLRDRIKNSESGLDATEALKIFIGYLDCLDHLHRNGIIHRDIKPGNLYAPARHPHKAKIFDLGIAHDEEGTRTHGQVPGTLDFMPPEFATQSSGRGSAQSDIYSIGVTLYQSLTKKLPFPRLPEKESEAWIAFFRRSENPVDYAFEHPVFNKHPELMPLLRRALAHDPKQRYASAGAMRDEIKKIVEKWDSQAARFVEMDEEATTMLVKPRSPAPLEKTVFIEEKPAEDATAATKAADLRQLEKELAVVPEPIQVPKIDPEQIERERKAAEKAAQLAQENARLAAEESQKRKREEAERLAKENERKAIEEAEKRKRDEAERLVSERERKAAEEIQRKKREKTEQLAQENARVAAEEAQKRKREEDARRAVVRAERAVKVRRATTRLAKVGAMLAVVAILVVGAIYGWKMVQTHLRESAFTKAVGNANDAYKSGDFTTAQAEADKALAIHKDDPDMQKLIADSQVQIKSRESFGVAMKNAQDAFDSRDYTNAAAWATAALQKVPDDPAVMKLQESAQKFVSDHNQAVNKANATYKNGNFLEAEAEADKALAIYKNDPATQKLKANAQLQNKIQEDYRAALQNAQTAFGNHDYSNTVAWASTALQKISGDTTATKLRDNARQLINDYHAAVNQADAAYKNGDFDGAVAAADQALAIYKNDPAMQKLKANAQAQNKVQGDYRAAIKSARAAYEEHDYANAGARAEAALQKMPGDAAATKLRDDAQKLIADYRAATDQAQTAYQRGDYPVAVAMADKALAVYPDDSKMQKLKTDAQAQNKTQEDYRAAMKSAQSAFDNHDYAGAVNWAGTALQKMAGDAAAAQLRDKAQKLMGEYNQAHKQAQAAYQRGDYAAALTMADEALTVQKDDSAMQGLKAEILRQLDQNFVGLLESFNVSVPAGIRPPEGKKTATLGAIGETGKPYYQAKVDNLEKAYRAGNWLQKNNRQASLKELRKAIDNWE